ncbi:hypothetical protein POM88_002499 [Heracleum sosnowskyi]|uniref:F-box domain-containing protein n=1 Tax=Heracleum sosnowskyi TaxID=360622 RepID=A0AAD8JEU1_9APIA|nr:hypothetical protein POM88_002499 [Heracleum sosnowskyi]
MENSGTNRGQNGQEDRISALPDELLHRILSSDVIKLNEVVRTCILSKRWVNLWRAFPVLHFTELGLALRNDKYVEFITKFLLGRAQQVETCLVNIDLRYGLDESVRSHVLLTLNQAVSHCVRELHIAEGKLDFELSFPVLTELTLYECDVSFTNWSLPFLTTLELYTVCPHGNETMLNFKDFPCLKNLNLGGLFYYSDPPGFVRIDPPNLENLDIYQGGAIPIPGCKFVISAPKLKCFRFYVRYVPVVSAEGGFPCLEEAWFSIYLGKGWSDIHMFFDEDYRWDLAENETMLKLSNLFREFRETKLLTIFSETFGVLSRLCNFFKYQPSPFVNLNSLYLRLRDKMLQLPNSNHLVIEYLLSNSPAAEFIIQEPFLE